MEEVAKGKRILIVNGVVYSVENVVPIIDL